MKVPLLRGFDDWSCPNCGLWERVPAGPVNVSRMHVCPKLHMLCAPLVRAGTDCKVEAAVREDYLGGETQRRGDDGKPYMNVTTTRADGSNDVAVFAPPARGGGEGT